MTLADYGGRAAETCSGNGNERGSRGPWGILMEGSDFQGLRQTGVSGHQTEDGAGGRSGLSR